MSTSPQRHPDPDQTRPVATGTPDPQATQQVVVRRQLGDYELAERVGEGGMGVVWRATGPRGRQVAVKVLREHIAHDQQARARLRREVQTLAQVSHPRVAGVLDADVEGSAPYIVTEFVPGPSLDQVVREQGPMRTGLLRLARGLAEALHAIHAAGIVHRDLKPGNVLMVGPDPVVIDFGIAQVADDVRLTSTGLVMGTPGYLSPEVADGAEVSPATDWWGWAATLAYAASGQPPFGRGPVAVVLDRVARGRVQLDGVDPALRPLLAAALDPDPARRPDEAQVLDALERYERHEDVTGALEVRPSSLQDPTSVFGRADSTRVTPLRRPDPARRQPEERPVWREPAPRPQSWQADGDRRPMAEPPRHQELVPAPRGGATAHRPGDAPGIPARDPRIGRSARTGTLAALLVTFVGVAMVAPLLAWGAFAAWGLVTRTVDRSITGMVLRRHELGRRRGDVALAVAATPWHVIAATLTTVLALLLPLSVTVVLALVFSGLVTTTELMVGIGPDHPLAVGLASLVGAWLGWWGLASTSLRRGSRTLVRGAVPSGVPSGVVVVVLLAAGLALAGYAATAGESVSWWPLGPTVQPQDWLPFQLPR